MKNFIFKIFCISLGVLCSCVKNDIPYPYVELNIQKIEGDGFTDSIDSLNLVATLILDEVTDIKAVNISNVVMTTDAKSSVELVGTFDMRDPINVDLTLYDNLYNWTITASQTIERYFEVEGQIGATVFNEGLKTATLNVANTRDITAINITSLKLGPEGITTYTPTIESLLGSQNFTYYIQVGALYHGEEEVWKLYVNQIEASVDISVCSPWTKSVWMEATGDLSSNDYGFTYCKVGDSDEIKVDQDNVMASNGTISVMIEDLEPSTMYQIRAYAGENVSELKIFTTGAETQMPNSSMDEWNNNSGSSYYRPYSLGDDAFWGTGNKGSWTMSKEITTPDYVIKVEGEASAYLESKTISGQFAAGNLFTGEFINTDGFDGMITFGRPFTDRPLSMKVWVKYSVGTVNKGGTMISSGDDDIGIIYIALGTWTKEEYGYTYNGNNIATDEMPLAIHTGDTKTFFNSSGKDVVAYGVKEFGAGDNSWVEIEIPLVYTNYYTVPTHIIVVGSSSKYGDYFEGSSSSKMWIDDLELVY